MRRAAPVVFTLVVTILALLPSTLTLGQHGDERQYAWGAGYYAAQVAKFSIRSTAGSPAFADPAWDPNAWWSLTQPMGARFFYAVALTVTGTSAPSQPYSYGLVGGPEWTGPESNIPADSLLILRGAAVLASAVGLSLFALRFGWRGALAATLFIAIPHVRADLARAWAEGPLILGLGLAAATYGSRWLGPVAGLAATFKLTALGLWPLLLLRGTRRERLVAVCAAVLVWTVLTPPAWFDGGPAYLGQMLRHRVDETPAHVIDGTAEGNAPTRYLLPFELALALGFSVALSRVMQGKPYPFKRRLTMSAPRDSRS